METKETKATKIAVLFCKDFPGVVRRALRKEAQPAQLSCRVLDGLLLSKDTGFFTVWPNDSEEIIASMLAEGYTPTAYLRLSDGEGFIPFDDEIEYAVATAVNMHILESLSLEVGPAELVRDSRVSGGVGSGCSKSTPNNSSRLFRRRASIPATL